MRWTKKVPTSLGYYWIKYPWPVAAGKQFHYEIVEVVEIFGMATIVRMSHNVFYGKNWADAYQVKFSKRIKLQ